MRFEFKQFGLEHGESAMKIGFDSVLLGSWADAQMGESVLDIGAGCGILGFMLTQKSANLRLTSLEKDPLAAQECNRNGAQMPWSINHEVVCADFKEFAGNVLDKFDVLISNPPYFEANGQIEGKEREQARQQSGLSLEDLFRGAAQLAHHNSVFFLVFPSLSSAEVRQAGRTFGWWCESEIEVKNKSTKPSKRTLWKWVRKPCELRFSVLLVNDESGGKSMEYRKLVDPFLL